MAIDALVKPLLALPLFQGLSPLQLTEIVRRAERIIYRPGDAIVTENQTGDAAIVIISGKCAFALTITVIRRENPEARRCPKAR